MLKILMVCMGNICRSPMAEAVVRALVERAGLSDGFEVDSAGTHAYHVGEAPDMRARQVAAKRGYDLSGLRARKIRDGDFGSFDLILAMDRANLAALERVCPEEYRSKMKLFMSYAEGVDAEEVPDPYYSSIEGFAYALDLCEAAGRGLLAACRADAQECQSSFFR